ncbi:BnaA09g53850D [Brassica napus]|uniref:BnaA09g53850D protein n=1 Tax=Brassica napus TaxID=3708 RepID=A0A078GVI0_BRANA|nr:BnaA09g53850D [Brassica napus]
MGLRVAPAFCSSDDETSTSNASRRSYI